LGTTWKILKNQLLKQKWARCTDSLNSFPVTLKNTEDPNQDKIITGTTSDKNNNNNNLWNWKRTTCMNIYQRQFRQVKIIKLLHYRTNKLQYTEPYHTTNLISHFKTEKENVY
jgi:hypothetical protein